MVHELGCSTWFPEEDVGVLIDLMRTGNALPELGGGNSIMIDEIITKAIG